MDVQISLVKAFDIALDQNRDLQKQVIQQSLVIQELQRELALKDGVIEQLSPKESPPCGGGDLPPYETHHH